MKRIQKLMGIILLSFSLCNAVIPTPATLNLSKNKGPEITEFIKKYITPQRPTVKNFGMLELDFDINDIQIGSQLKPAIESRKVVVARRKKARWRQQLEDNYEFFIDLDAIKTKSDVMDLEGAFTQLNNYMNRSVTTDKYIRQFPKSAQEFMNYYNTFIDAGGQAEPFQTLVDLASLTIKRSKKSAFDADAARKALLAKTRAENAKTEAERKEFAEMYADRLTRLIALINKDADTMSAEDYAEMDDLSKGMEDATETIGKAASLTGIVTAEDINTILGDSGPEVVIVGALPRALPKIDLTEKEMESVIENIFNKAKKPKMLPAGTGIKALPTGIRPKPLPASKPLKLLSAPAERYQLKAKSGVKLYGNDLEKAEKARQLSRKRGLNFATKAIRILKRMPK